MKDLENFTVDELTGWTDTSESSGNPDWYPDPWEVAALARVALAAKRAEPVAWVVGDATLYNSDTVEAYAKRSGLPVSPLYTTPQLNSQQGWIKCSDHMPESQQWGLVWAKWFNQQVLCWEDVGGQWTDFDGQSYSQDQITHWMPLPAAPEKENG